MLPSEDTPLLSQHHQVDLTAPPNHLKRSHHELKPKPWKPFRFRLVLLMEEIQAKQLIKYPVIYKVLQILELVQYFFHQPYHLKFTAIFQVDFYQHRMMLIL